MHDGVAPEELAKWNRWFAIETNNRAWRLAESTMRTGANAAAAAGNRELHAIFEATFRVVRRTC